MILGKKATVTASPEMRAFGRSAYGTGRVSRQRVSIALVVDASPDRAFSAEDLAALVRLDDPGIGLATVYRALAAMESSGFIEPVGERNGAVVYARCVDAGHHHHVVCTCCGMVEDAECPVGGTSAGANGFRITGHRLVLYGICPSCQRAAPEPGDEPGRGRFRVRPASRRAG